MLYQQMFRIAGSSIRFLVVKQEDQDYRFELLQNPSGRAEDPTEVLRAFRKVAAEHHFQLDGPQDADLAEYQVRSRTGMSGVQDWTLFKTWIEQWHSTLLGKALDIRRNKDVASLHISCNNRLNSGFSGDLAATLWLLRLAKLDALTAGWENVKLVEETIKFSSEKPALLEASA